MNDPTAWRQQMPQLAGLPLLPIGAGSDKKAPAHPNTGELLKGWPSAAFTPEQVANACREVIAVGFRPGPDSGGLIAFDIDGATAIERCRSHGCDPLTAPTWQVRRDTAADRLKVVWRVPDDLRGALVHTVAKLTTKPPSGPGARDGENVATYYGAGQVIVLGQHTTSGGNYLWPDGHGPADVAEIPPEWWALADVIAKADPQPATGAKTSGRTTSGSDWRRVNPCPICGRDGHLICSRHRDGRSILCFHGSTFSPPDLKPGAVITGRDGERWAFTVSRKHFDGGVFSHFKIDEPRPETDYTDGFEVIEGGTSVQGCTQAGASRTLAGPSKRVRLSAYDVVQRLPLELGTIRRNIRSGEVMTERRGVINGNDIGRLYVALSSSAETWPKDATADAVASIANANPYDPVRDYLEGIGTSPLPTEQWQRLDQHLLGIDHPIAAAFLPRYFISAVARAMEPGCDVRQLPVLIGPQWRGKSSLGKILFTADHWIEGIGTIDRDSFQRCHMAWGVELAELEGITRRNDMEKLKAALTETVDTFRAPYDRSPEKHHRRFVFWGTANSPPLADPTGSTRFVCIEIPDRMLPLDWAIEHRNALWARAVEQYRAGVRWDRVSEEERRAIEEMNSDFQAIDPWAPVIAERLDDAIRYGRLPVVIPKLLEGMEIETGRQSPAMAARVRTIAHRLGWKHCRRRWQGGKARQGLWPADIDNVHPAQGVCTPTHARSDGSHSLKSDPAVHPVHPFPSTKEKKGQEGGEKAA